MKREPGLAHHVSTLSYPPDNGVAGNRRPYGWGGQIVVPSWYWSFLAPHRTHILLRSNSTFIAQPGICLMVFACHPPIQRDSSLRSPSILWLAHRSICFDIHILKIRPICWRHRWLNFSVRPLYNRVVRRSAPVDLDLL